MKGAVVLCVCLIAGFLFGWWEYRKIAPVAAPGPISVAAPEAGLDVIPLDLRRASWLVKDMAVGERGYVWIGYCVDADWRVRLDPEGVVYRARHPNLERRMDGYYFTADQEEIINKACRYPVVAKIVR